MFLLQTRESPSSRFSPSLNGNKRPRQCASLVCLARAHLLRARDGFDERRRVVHRKKIAKNRALFGLGRSLAVSRDMPKPLLTLAVYIHTHIV